MISNKFEIEKKRSIKWKSGYMGIYSIKCFNKYISQNDLLMDFFKPDNYLVTNESALGNPFDISSLNILDFNRFNKNDLFNFLSNFSDPLGWSNPREIEEEVAFLKEEVLDSTVNNYYLLDTNHIIEKEKKLTIESYSYIYYFLIIWCVDDCLFICQMCLD